MTDHRPKVAKAEHGPGVKRKANTLSPSTPNPYHLPSQQASSQAQKPPGTFQIPAIPIQVGTAGPPQKVAIPRLRRGSDVVSNTGSTRAGDKHRISHACEPCRHRKTKCSGERPTCKHCEDFKIVCLYADGKRDRVKKEFSSMAGRLHEYEKLLRQLSLRTDGSDHILIEKALDKESTSEDDDIRSTPSSVRPSLRPNGSEDGENHAPARTGSVGSVDQIDEDFNRNQHTRATGYMGKISELKWLHRLKGQVGRDLRRGEEDCDGWVADGHRALSPNHRPDGHLSHSPQDMPFDADGGVGGVSDSTYHCDDQALIMQELVAPKELPLRETAEHLLQTYLDTVHPVFPIIGKLTFWNQVQTFFDNDQLTPGNKWFAILNLIFAIAANYSHLVQADWRGDERDHLVYFNRARLLGMDGDAIFEHPDLQRVQVAGLMAFYLLSINQVNRAYAIHGFAVRSSLALGLHLRNENKRVSDVSKEIRYRVWWALYSLERHIGVMTGRPSLILDTDCSTPMPIPLDEETFCNPNGGMPEGEVLRKMRRYSSQDSTGAASNSPATPSTKIKASPDGSPVSPKSGYGFLKNLPPTMSLYFVRHTQLSKLTHETLAALYSASAMKRSWGQIQSAISSLASKLEIWRASLQPAFDFTNKQQDHSFHRQRISLGFFYYSTSVVITRPCLCRMDHNIAHESHRSRDFNRNAAIRCVRAAKGIVGLIPAGTPDPPALYKIAPWWCTVHYLMQAATVLMLELSFRADHMPFEAEEILESARKAVRWLNAMAAESIAACRAWKICNEMLRKVAPKIGRDVNDLPTDTPPSRSQSQHSNVSRHSQSQSSQEYDVWGGLQPFTRQFQDHGYHGESTLPGSHAEFNPSVLTSYDEYIPFMSPTATTAAPPDLSYLFPASVQMDTMATVSPDHSRHNFYYPPSQSWNPHQHPN